MKQKRGCDMYHFEQIIEYDVEIDVDNLIKAIKEELSSYYKMGKMGTDKWLEEVKLLSDDDANEWMWECIQEAINNEKYPAFIIDGDPRNMLSIRFIIGLTMMIFLIFVEIHVIKS
jgi:adenylate kinase family enzyme